MTVKNFISGRKLLAFTASAVTVLASLTFLNVPAASASTTISAVDHAAQTNKTSMVGGDLIDITSGGSVTTTGDTTQTITTQWSGQSLELNSVGSVVTPENWNTEFTTDGTTWSGTAPTRTTITGIRTTGSVNPAGPNVYKSVSHPLVVNNSANFTGGGGGDGFDVALVGNRVFNVYHHNTVLAIQCHLKSGTSCYTGSAPVISGYGTNNSAQEYWDSATSNLWVYSYRVSDKHVGFACVNFSNINAAALCATPFVDLSGVSVVAYTNMNTSSRSGDYLWSIDSTSDSLLCMQISTAAACPSVGGNPTNGFPVGPVGTSDASQGEGRVTADGTKVYYLVHNAIGCFDAATGLTCSGFATGVGHEVAYAAGAYNSQPIPIRNTSGVLLGYCNYDSRTCISPLGVSVSMPAGLAAFAAANQLPLWQSRDNAGEWAAIGTKLFFTFRGVSGTNTVTPTDVYCWDSSTDARCTYNSGANNFDGTAVGTQIYALVADPIIANCVWINGNTGAISNFSAITGAVGCSSGSSTVQMPYTAIAPRFACLESSRVLTWNQASFVGTADVNVSDLLVTIFDSSGNPIAGWVDRALTGGVLDISALTTIQTGMQPHFEITSSDNADTATMLSAISATVTFGAEAPQLCFTLQAVTKCVGITLAGGDNSVPAGLLEVATHSVPATGSAVDGLVLSSITGSNSGNLCAPTTPHTPPPSVDVPQRSSITGVSCSPGATGFVYTVTGSFGSQVYNVIPDDVALYSGNWSQTASTVTLKTEAELSPNSKLYIYNGQVPVLSASVPSCVKAAEVPTPTPTPSATGTPANGNPSSMRLSVYFVGDRATLLDSSKATLKEFATKAAAAGRAISVGIVGRVKRTNDVSYDMALSNSRANTVSAYLKGRGVTGTYSLNAAGISPENTAKSRRVDILITWGVKK